MTKPLISRSDATGKAAPAKRPHLPDPKTASGPYRSFTSDPGWSEAWWWLGIPIAVGVLVPLAYRLDPEWYKLWVAREGPSILETAQFIIMVIGLAIAVQLLLDPFVRRRPLGLALTILAALTCFYIAGEEICWGQVLFGWQDPELISATNREGEFSLHNEFGLLERVPRAALEIGVLIGGLTVPLCCAIVPRWRESRISLFLPSAILVPTAVGAAIYKLADLLAHSGRLPGITGRPSETIEFYLYFFILGYLVVFERRIRELETEKPEPPPHEERS
jgi:hypothetical protein